MVEHGDSRDQGPDLSLEERWDTEELALVTRVLNSFLGYAVHHHRVVTNAKRVAFFALPIKQQHILLAAPSHFLQRMQAVEDAIDTNANCALDILKTGLSWTGLEKLVPLLENPPTIVCNLPCLPGLAARVSNATDFAKASSTLRHLYREWSAEGAAERAKCFSPLLDYLSMYYKDLPHQKRHSVRVLNPGCGLGRFVFELACAGFNAEGIEISYHMLFGSMHMMNAIQHKHQYKIFPFALGGSNHIKNSDRTRHVLVPDICPREVIQNLADKSEIPIPERLGISSGDFSTVFKDQENRNAYDVLATVFFLDTAKNPLAYIETAANCIKPGGIWMNLGPLKWHFEYEQEPNDSPSPSIDSSLHHASTSFDLGIGEPGSVELSEDDILRLLSNFGFELIYRKPAAETKTGYIHDPLSMEETIFSCSFWVARRLG